MEWTKIPFHLNEKRYIVLNVPTFTQETVAKCITSLIGKGSREVDPPLTVLV